MFDPAAPLSSLLSRTPARVYELFLDAPDSHLRPTQLAAELQLDRKTIHTALKKLSGLGLVIQHGTGRHNTFTLNQDHVMAGPLRQIADATTELERRLRALMKHGWEAELKDRTIHLTAPTERAHKTATATANTKRNWRAWTGQDIDVTCTTRVPSC
ncbi:winged helix-turn-helix domain-containing protein [Agromyces mediolanus]|uniref:Uncharacterized protein n=1 Tax=Agromyces mediolanus TaxID=41986 RepID=A0A918CAZ1_AGRME|nr:winged helix-turn-helix domain-containing protein [Agromyces mediolanus]GGR13565.1 hypothetical protein GCM10010196_02630 [Agromyces mediolanus]GLJ72667.1 hypothetical protein GCM10017583_19230 [Agromyces mediolanus]